MSNYTPQHFARNNAHPHDDSGQARLLEQLAMSAVIKNDYARRTLSGDLTMDGSEARVQNIDPGGSARTVTLPAEEEGLTFVIANRADAAESITVEDDSNSTLVTVAQDEVAQLVSDGTGWIAQSAAGAVT